MPPFARTDPRSIGGAPRGPIGSAPPPPPPPVQLVLSAKRETWRMHDQGHEEADAEFRIRRDSILARDRHMCKGVGCGFISMKWQEVHHRDDNHRDNDDANLATLCGFCHSVFHVGLASENGSLLIWLPDIGDHVSQGELNRIVRTLYVGMAQSSGGVGEACRTIIGALQKRANLLAERIGFCDPRILGEVFLKMSSSAYRDRDEKLFGVRLLCGPHKRIGGRDMWSDAMTYWNSKDGPYGGLQPSTWPTLFRQLNKLLGSDVVNPNG